MSRGVVFAALVLWGAALVVACGAKTRDQNGTDTSTDWVQTCDADRDCRPDQRCGCGLCTRECDTDADCQDLSSAAICRMNPTECGVAESLCVPDESYSWLNQSAGEPSEAETDDEAPRLSCLAARDLRECCYPFLAVTAEELESDPCYAAADLEPLEVGEARARCDAPDPCPGANCAITTLGDQVAVESPPGECSLVELCDGQPCETECVVAYDLNACCYAPGAFDGDAVEEEACLVPAAGMSWEQAASLSVEYGCNQCPANCGAPPFDPGVDLIALSEGEQCSLGRRCGDQLCECIYNSDCAADEACAAGVCSECQGVSEQALAVAETIPELAEGCQSDADCVYFKQPVDCGALRCPFGLSHPTVRDGALVESLMRVTNEVCAAENRLGCRFNTGASCEIDPPLYELECRDTVCEATDNPCSLEGYQSERLEVGWPEGCGRITYSNGSGDSTPEEQAAAFTCLQTAYQSCEATTLTIAQDTIEGDVILTEWAIAPSEEGCEIMLFNDSTRDAFGMPVITRLRCEALEFSEEPAPPTAMNCSQEAQCAYLSPLRE